MKKILLLLLIIFSVFFVSANSPPVLNISEVFFNLYEFQDFELQIEAYDPDNETLIFSDDSKSEAVGWDGFYMSTTGFISLELRQEDVGLHIVAIIVKDPFENEDSELLIFNVSNANDPPVINSFSPETPVSVNEGEEKLFSISVTDPDDDQVSYNWVLDSNDFEGSDNEVNVLFDYQSSGDHNLTVSLSDGNHTLSHSWDISVSNVDTTPYFQGEISDLSWHYKSQEEVAISDYFGDDDSDALTYSLLDNEYISYEVDENEMVLKSLGNWTGNTSIVFRATDPGGNYVDSNTVGIDIFGGIFCGDGLCEDGESCSSCSEDCGSCPSSPSSSRRRSRSADEETVEMQEAIIKEERTSPLEKMELKGNDITGQVVHSTGVTEKGKTSWKLIFGIIVVVLLALGGTKFYFYRKKKRFPL